jgi:hypothetical protein
VTTPETRPPPTERAAKAEPAETAVPVEHERAEQMKRPAGRWHFGWSWTVGKEWLIPSGVAVATLLLGAAFGAISASTPGQKNAYLAVGAAGVVVLILTGVVSRGKERMLRRNGTAYLIEESAREWSPDNSRDFVAGVKRQFARTVQVPGPGKLKIGGAWDWPLGDGAQHWDTKLTELTWSFYALHETPRSGEDDKTPSGVFMWAWWAVAVAFGLRVTAADRGLKLDIWQRPSRSRAGQVEPRPWSQRPHRFGEDGAGSLARVLPGSAPQEMTWPAEVTVRPHAPLASGAAASAAPVVLLVRLGRQRWGPLVDVDQVPAPDPAKPVHVVLEDWTGLIPGKKFDSEICELRCLPPDGGSQFPWEAFPSLVAEVSGWIERKTAGLDGKVLLLGAILPPEVALGLGIEGGQVSRQEWPEHLWPIVYDPGARNLVLPHLDLGTAAFTNREV